MYSSIPPLFLMEEVALTNVIHSVVLVQFCFSFSLLLACKSVCYWFSAQLVNNVKRTF